VCCTNIVAASSVDNQYVCLNVYTVLFTQQSWRRQPQCLRLLGMFSDRFMQNSLVSALQHAQYFLAQCLLDLCSFIFQLAYQLWMCIMCFSHSNLELCSPNALNSIKCFLPLYPKLIGECIAPCIIFLAHYVLDLCSFLFSLIICIRCCETYPWRAPCKLVSTHPVRIRLSIVYVHAILLHWRTYRLLIICLTCAHLYSNSHINHECV
jgi:hypothetical protein